MNKKFLIIGPRTNRKEPEKTGGAIVLFENLLEELNTQNINYTLIDTNKKNYKNSLIALLSINSQILTKQFGATHISLHSSNDYKILAPMVLLMGKVFRKSTSLRKFGGEAWKVYNDATGLKRVWLKFIFSHIDYLFLELQFMVKNFKEINKNTFWFPNVRAKPEVEKKDKEFSKRFVFISQVFPEKGVDEILEVSNRLSEEYIIDIYGPIKDKKYTDEYFSNYKANYCGALEGHQVLKALSDYDALLLPTYYKGEGYPGIIIESYSLGIPVIATTLMGIKEITKNYETGILIEPKNTNELKEAIEYFTKENYPSFVKSTKMHSLQFNSHEQTKKFLSTIQD